MNRKLEDIRKGRKVFIPKGGETLADKMLKFERDAELFRALHPVKIKRKKK